MKTVLFENDYETLNKLKEFKFLSKTKTIEDLSNIIYKTKNYNHNVETFNCKILGYNWKETSNKCINKKYQNLIVKVNDNIFNINIDYLKEMQKNSNNNEEKTLEIDNTDINKSSTITTNTFNENDFLIVHLVTGPRKGVIVRILKDRKEYTKTVLETAIKNGFNNATKSNLSKKTIMNKHYANTYTNINYYNNGEYFNLDRNKLEFSLEHKTSDYIFIDERLSTAYLDSKNYNRIVSIDFETSNGNRASVCSIGFVVEENGKIIKECELLVNPRAEFSKISMSIHKIKPDDVKDSPTWEKVWPIVEGYITSDTLVIGHNIRSTELSCIRKECERYNMPIPNFAKLHSKMAYDTLTFSKEKHPKLKNYKLDYLCHLYNIKLNHHNALSDAKASLELFNMLKNDVAFTNNDDTYFENQKNKPVSKLYVQYHKELIPNTDVFDENHICFNKKFIFTGTFTTISKKDASQIVLDSGGKLGCGVTKDTKYLVIGNIDYNNLSSGKMSNKTKKAYQYKDLGIDIQIISEDDFLSLIK